MRRENAFWRRWRMAQLGRGDQSKADDDENSSTRTPASNIECYIDVFETAPCYTSLAKSFRSSPYTGVRE